MKDNSRLFAVHDISGHPGYALKVYGATKARNLTEEMQQGFTVLVQGRPTARAELPKEVQQEVQRILDADYPEHALI